MRTTKKRKKWTKGRRADFAFVCIMLALPIVQFCIMWIGVNTNSILLAFKQYDVDFNYVWTTANFVRVFKELAGNEMIQGAFGTSILFFVCSTILTIPFSLLVSFYFYKRWRFSKIFRVGYFIPTIISGIVTVTVFLILVDRVYPQIINRLTGKDVLGLLVNPNTKFGVVLFFNIFYSLVGGFLFYSSFMSSIDDGISEAAQIDGASALQEFFYITLPNIFPILTLQLIGALPTIFTNDFAMFTFFKAAGISDFTTVGNYFITGITTQGEGSYPYYTAFGLVLSLFSCILIYGAKAIFDRVDPMRDQDGAEAKKRLERKLRREEHIHDKKIKKRRAI